jgi:hypothetical protein
MSRQDESPWFRVRALRRKHHPRAAGGSRHIEPLECRLLLAGAAGQQPDLQIRNYGDTPYGGVGIFNTTAEQQSDAQGSPFFPVIFQVKVVNTGARPDSFIITGSRAGTPNYRVWYFDSQVQGSPQTGPPGGQDISAQVIAKGWNTGLLQPGEFKELRFEAGASAFAPAGAQQTITLTARSASDRREVDVVRGTATNDVRRSIDIRRRNTSGPGPYLVDLENTGNIADQYRVIATPGGPGYTVKYFDAYIGGNDITAAITSANGWTTAPIGFHGLQHLAIQITPADSQAHQISMLVYSVGDAGVGSTATLSTAPTAAPPAFFPIGVFRQPTFEFDTWKSRGINTLVDWDNFGGAASMDQWTQAAVDRQLYMIRAPRTDATLDVNQPYLLAWMHPDEAELRGDYPAATALQNYNALKQMDPAKPVLSNFAGGYILGWQTGSYDYPGYIEASDWVSSGTYPISGWNRPDDLDASGRTLDRFEKLSTNGAPNFAIIESSNQMGPWNPPGVVGPTPAQVRAETWDAIVHGARGVIYFPQSLTPTFSYDNTTPQVAAEITKQNALITSIGAALESPIDPPAAGVSASSPLEATWRIFNGKTYLVVLNMSSQKLTKQKLTLAGIAGAKATVQGEKRTVRIARSAITDSFAPYAVHIYVV